MADEASGCGEGCCGEAARVELPQGQEARDELLARYARALGHPARVAILRLVIARRGCICGEIVDELPLAQSTVSQHLKQLKEAGLLRGEVDGPRVCYCVEPGALWALRALLGEVIDGAL